jgi:hypothetical protein
MAMRYETNPGRRNNPYGRASILIMFVCFVSGLTDNAAAQLAQHEIQALNVTVLSTMLVADTTGIGEWGFADLVEADGHRLLVDTGAQPDTALRNAHYLHIDLSDVEEVVLTHSHWGHVGGLLMLRRELMKKNAKALSVVHLSEGAFDSRPSDFRERNPLISISKEYVATGGRFVVHSSGTELGSRRLVDRANTSRLSRTQLERGRKGSDRGRSCRRQHPRGLVPGDQYPKGTGGDYRMRARRNRQHHYVCREAF